MSIAIAWPADARPPSCTAPFDRRFQVLADNLQCCVLAVAMIEIERPIRQDEAAHAFGVWGLRWSGLVAAAGMIDAWHTRCADIDAETAADADRWLAGGLPERGSTAQELGWRCHLQPRAITAFRHVWCRAVGRKPYYNFTPRRNRHTTAGWA